MVDVTYGSTWMSCKFPKINGEIDGWSRKRHCLHRRPVDTFTNTRTPFGGSEHSHDKTCRKQHEDQHRKMLFRKYGSQLPGIQIDTYRHQTGQGQAESC